MSNSSESEKTVKGYKGFDKNMQCRGFQFKAGETYENEGEIEVCKSGFHFCENPIDVLRYYGPATSEYHEVEGVGEIQNHSVDSKKCASKITIGDKVSIKSIISLGVKFFIEKTKSPTSGDSSTSATSGDFSPSATSGYSSTSATSGDFSPSATSGNSSPSATSGNSSPSATSGDSSTSATSGDSSTSATSGNSSPSATSGYTSPSATSGNSSTSATSWDYSPSATSGDYSPSATNGNSSPSATSGDYSPSATSGNSSTSATSGYSSHSETKGKNSIACALGKNSKVKSAIGNWIVSSEYGSDGDILSVKTAKVDGKKIKADTFYVLKNGEFTEAM